MQVLAAVRAWETDQATGQAVANQYLLTGVASRARETRRIEKTSPRNKTGLASLFLYLSKAHGQLEGNEESGRFFVGP